MATVDEDTRGAARGDGPDHARLVRQLDEMIATLTSVSLTLRCVMRLFDGLAAQMPSDPCQAGRAPSKRHP